MILSENPGHLVLGLVIAGLGLVFWINDRRGYASQPVALALACIGGGLILNDTGGSWSVAALSGTLEALAILAGVEWGRRVGQMAPAGRLRTATQGLFRAAQILILVFWGLLLGYLAIAPDKAMSDSAGILRLDVIELAVFLPIVSTAMLLVVIAIVMLLMMRIDRAEATRLHALMASGPFLLGALMVNSAVVPYVMTVGLLIFIGGSIRYLMIQGQRGQFMSRFLSPEVARMVSSEGMDRALQRERRVLSVLACDLRGFTAFARQHDSGTVMSLLERYYERVGEVAGRHRGTVKDHAGDGVLLLVGAPLPVPDHAGVAVALARELSAQVQQLLADSGYALGFGIGIATGHVTVGAIHGAGRLEYAAVGNPVNLAARLCDRAADGEILMDRRTFESLPAGARPDAIDREPEPLKGFAEPVPVVSLSAAP